MAEVFISYAREDAASAERIAKALLAAGYDAFWDAHIAPHQSYGDVIKDKIADAGAVIVIWSEHSAKSVWVRAEAEEAYGQGKLVQTLIDDARLPMPFGQIQTASLVGWQGDQEHKGWRDVLRSLGALSSLDRVPGPVDPDPGLAVDGHAPTPEEKDRKPWILISAIITIVLLVAVASIIIWLSTRDPDPVTPTERSLYDAVVTPPDQVIPDSSDRALNLQELTNLNNDALRIARNEIFARKGRIFLDPALRAHFERYDWYTPISEEVELTAIEEDNIRLIRSQETE